MFYHLTDSSKRAHFDFSIRKILQSPPLSPYTGHVKLVSEIRHADLRMYLLAIKSFRRQIPYAEITVLDDGTLTNYDHEILQCHLSPVEVLPAKDIVYGRGVKGIRWEILLYIAQCVETHYVIQIDSDTVTIGQVPEIHAAVQSNRSFTLGTRMGRHIVPACQMCDEMKKYKAAHVQIAAEQNLDKLPGYPNLYYVRGNSGLTGFAKGCFTRSQAEDFYEEMGRNIGEIWRKHGGYQVSSNFFVANSPGAQVLPWPKYACYVPGGLFRDSVFMHFVGTNRFDRGEYLRVARGALKLLLEDEN